VVGLRPETRASHDIPIIETIISIINTIRIRVPYQRGAERSRARFWSVWAHARDCRSG
jgi:hypothetical protein